MCDSDHPDEGLDPYEPDNYDDEDNLCPACGGDGKANVDENGDVQAENPDDLDCDWCNGTGIGNE